MADMSNAEFIRDLAARMFRNATPAMGFDQGDTDRLYVIANRLAALEQAGEPVTKLHYSGDVMEAVQQLLERGRATLDSEGYLVTHSTEAPLPTLQRLGQEFDAGEEVELLAAMLFESVGDMTWHDTRAEMLIKDEWRQLAKRGLELLRKRFPSHPPQSRGQAFDGEGEVDSPWEFRDSNSRPWMLELGQEFGDDWSNGRVATRVTEIGHKGDHWFNSILIEFEPGGECPSFSQEDIAALSEAREAGALADDSAPS